MVSTSTDSNIYTYGIVYLWYIVKLALYAADYIYHGYKRAEKKNQSKC